MNGPWKLADQEKKFYTGKATGPGGKVSIYLQCAPSTIWHVWTSDGKFDRMENHTTKLKAFIWAIKELNDNGYHTV